MAKRKRHGTNPESAQRKRPRNSSTKSNGDSHKKPSTQLEDDTPCPGTCNKRSPSMYPNEMYTVAWVCALSIELAAAKGMLDETHGQPQSQPNGDPNTYTLGRIHEFNVVIACLPADGYGTCSAANLVGTMWTTFPNLKIGLFVGIGAAIPWFSGDSIRDIRLGDVVVGTRIVDYEMRKRYDEGMVKNTGHQERPSKILRSAIQGLKADHQTKSPKITQYIDGMTQRHAERGAFTYPLGIADRLCETCLSGGKCAGGGKATKPQSRPDRPDKHSRIHYGVIASGNTLCRDRDFREEMQKKFDAICFDMEAAGVMNNFHGLVVRGISDYADCHKNDDWHSYAAASAAGYAKLLLSYVPLNVKHAGSLGYGTTRAPEHGVQEMKVLDWISKETFESRHVDHLNRLQPDTGDWFLSSRQFKRFVGGIVTRLFCPGMPGAGKTMISTLAIDFLRREYQQDPMVAVCFLYFDYRIKYDNVTEVLAIILRQLAAQKLPLAEPVRLLFEKYGIRDSKPPLKEHILTLQAVLLQWKTVFLVVDAIDECPSSNSTRQAFLEDLHAIQANSKLRIMITSRPNPDIVGVMKDGGARFLEIRARDEDVKAYIKGRLRKSDLLAGQSSKLQRRIKRQITKAADGMFLLAQLYIDRLSHLRVPRKIEDALTELPQGTNVYSDAFDQAMYRIESQVTENKELAKKALSWITNAARPLSKKELQHALALRPTDIVFLKSGMPQMDHILSVCVGLVVLDKESGTVRLVHYTAQQYFEDKSGQWFEDAKVTIAKTCLQYLSPDDFRGQPGIDEIKSHYDRRRYHLYNYSVKNLAYHLRGTLPQLGRELMQFLTHDKLTDTFANELFYSESDRLYTSPCHIAAALDLDGTISELLKDGHNANAPDVGDNSPLVWAVKFGSLKAARRLLEEDNVEPNALARCREPELGYTYMMGSSLGGLSESNVLGPLGYTPQISPLMMACKYGHEDMIAMLLANSQIDMNAVDYCARTALHYACRANRTGIIALLVGRICPDGNPPQLEGELPVGRIPDMFNDILLDSVDDQGETPFYLATARGNIDAMKMLLETGRVGVNKGNKYGETPLIAAARQGHTEAASLLLERDADPNQANSVGETPLHRAVIAHRKDVVNVLLQHARTDSFALTNSGQSALSLAAESGSVSIVRMLLAHQNWEQIYHDTGDQELLQILSNDEIANLAQLIRSGRVHPNARRNFRSLIYWAVEKGHFEVVKALLDSGASANSKEPLWGRLLAIPAKAGRIDLVRLLLSRGADPTLCDFHKRTPIHYAVSRGHYAITKLLLQESVAADLPQQARLLAGAAEVWDGRCLDLLIEQGCNVNHVDSDGNTPLRSAVKSKSVTAVKRLLQKGASADLVDEGILESASKEMVKQLKAEV